jgi:hypothetical protein
MSKSYEEKRENQEDIPVPSRRTQEEREILEYLDLREDIEVWYKKIRVAKSRVEELLSSNKAVASLDKQLKKRPREIEEERIAKKKKRVPVSVEKLEEEEEKKKKKRLKNARKKKIETHRSYLKQGYTMTEQEISVEGGELEKQYVYFKKLDDNKSSTHVMKGMEGLKLSSNLGEEDLEMQFSE